MARNYGLEEYRRMYDEEEFKDGCTINLWMGVFIGIVFTVVVELGLMWYSGWIW